MKRLSQKTLLLFLFLEVAFSVSLKAQTLTIHDFSNGTYTPGSSIGVPFTISAAGCIQQNNVFQLYLATPAGVTIGAPIGTFTGFYGTYVNGVIPVGTAPGTYTMVIKSTSPAVSSAASAPFTVIAGTVVTAGINGVLLGADAHVFGVCNGATGNKFNFTSASTGGVPTTANFWNESDQTSDATVTLAPNGSFTAQTTNYTIITQATNGTTIGTQAYTLLNNVVNNSFAVQNSSTICLVANSGATLSYFVDIAGVNGIQKNYPGTTYNVTWGDGSSNNYTLCDIQGLGGQISHTYTSGSCGHVANGKMNAFEIDISPKSPYCSAAVSPITSYANVLRPPRNDFTFPPAGCTNSTIVFTNTSDPGQDAGSSSNSCTNPNARYTWYVDGVPIVFSRTLSQNFTYTFTTKGNHTITLELENSSSGICSAANLTQTICIEDPPQPIFILPASPICSSAPIIPTNNSIIDPGCNNTNTNIWTVTGPAPVTYAGGTNANSPQPQFVFTQAGSYKITLGISTTGCGVITSSVQTINIDTPPAVTLSPDVTLCGTNIVYNFNPNPGPTKTVITGVSVPSPSSYSWTVTGGAYSFATGSTASDQYPKIIFNDPTTYTVSVTVTTICGTVTKQQLLTFQNAPVVTVSPSATNICPGTSVTLTGAITGPYTSFQWIGSGTFSDLTSLTPVYTPTAAEIAAGKTTVTLDVKTALTGQCADIPQNVTVNIYPVNTISSSPIKQICTGDAVNYSITSPVTGSTYSWTATLTSGTATGFNSGSGNTINDAITNTATADAVITYTITPQANGCNGTPFTLTVTVKQLSTITAIPANSTICSGNPSAINLTSNTTGTTYTWTSAVTGSITGNTKKTVATTTTAINDILTNTGTLPGTVTYIITPYNGTCPGTPVTVSVTVQPMPVIANPGPNDEQCNITVYTLNGNAPPTGMGTWTQIAGPNTAVIVAPTNPQTQVTGLLPGNTYQFLWTITIPGCTSTSNSVIIKDDAPTIPGITAGATSVCSGGNTGIVTLSGQNGSIVRWESSIDNGTTWLPIVNTTATLSYSNLAKTTQYRAAVQSGVCGTLFSTATAITVNPNTVASNAGIDQKLCGAATITLNGNDPAPFTGTWTQTSGPIVVITDPTNPNTQVTGLIVGNIYKFTWTIVSPPPCGNTQSTVTITDNPDVIANFTASQQTGCGSFTVNFTNTSNFTTGVSFVWDFGDGSTTSTITNPQHIFTPLASGRDTMYIVSLKIIGNCVDRPAITVPITIRPQTPVAKITPLQASGCGAFALTVKNTSPGTNTQYDFYLYKGTTLIQTIRKTDKSDVQFDPISTPVSTVYDLYMIATGFCNNKGESIHIPITISPISFVPNLVVKNNQIQGCAPVTITLVNISSGGNIFYYNIYDSDQKLIETFAGSKGEQSYTFTKPGTYYASITASDNCGSLESVKTRIDVYPVPVPDFNVKTTVENGKIVASFINLTKDQPNQPASTLTYDWDYGDGSAIAHGFTPPNHLYDSQNSYYTVTMTATNPAFGCSAVVSKKNIIDRSILAGTLYLPNAFIPTSINTTLQTFKAKGVGIKEWHLSIFNNWGQLVWETTKLDSGGSPTEGWDGTFKGAPAQQGVYEWQGTATFLNGTEWKGMSFKGSTPKRVGYLTLIR
jgi:PKD repeat protein